ncbi:hypothetical protein LCGC14_2883340, partial [marine sediment metagenome]
MKIGFTGTQQGMTVYQQSEVRQLLESMRHQKITAIHHGGCIGADSQFHYVCHAMMLVTPTIHPASDVGPDKVGIGDYAIVLHAEPALKRNRTIVDSVDVLIATPA